MASSRLLQKEEEQEELVKDRQRLNSANRRRSFMSEINQSFNDALDQVHGEFVAAHPELTIEELNAIMKFIQFQKGNN